ncbi:MAG: dihydropteroate synthase [Bacteroidetes bacterium]|nr:dihydropteroate synthase [Bacteroidota bacterium]
MGIVNLTPDSFYDGGRFQNIDDVINYVVKIVEEGADIIDLGAISTRPGAKEVTLEEEESRLMPVLKKISSIFPDIIISVDTFRSQIAKMAVNNGAHIINDISAGNFDKDMFSVISELQVPYIIMHIQGNPLNMQNNPVYKNVTTEVIEYLSEKVEILRKLGVNDIIIDPGFGFGKTVEHNYELLKNLEYFSIFELPILVGLSRKSMINKVLGTTPENALNGTTVLNTYAILKGANILRVHDVKEAEETVKLLNSTNCL